MKRGFVLLSVLMMLVAMPLLANGNGEKQVPAAKDEVTTIVYWQYFLDTKVDLMNELIMEFEAQNPMIKVEQQTFPYENYSLKVAATVPTGKGPNIVCLFYGWLPQYIKAGYLQPLPDSVFSSEKVESQFLPMVNAAKFFGK